MSEVDCTLLGRRVYYEKLIWAPLIKAPPHLLDLLAHLLRTLKDARGLTLDQVGMNEEHMAPVYRRKVRVATPAFERAPVRHTVHRWR